MQTLSKLGIDKNFLNLIQNIYQKSTGNVKLNDEKLKAFSLIGRRQGCSLSLLSLSIILEFLDSPIIQEKETKGIQIGKKEIIMLLPPDDMIFNVENPKELKKTNIPGTKNKIL